MFVLESTYDGAGTIPETALMTNSEAGTYGEVVKFSSGRLTKCGVDDTPVGVLAKTTSAGTNVETEFIRVRTDQVWLADYDGDTPPTVGGVYGLDSTGLKIDPTNTSDGDWEVISVDSTKGKCRVKAIL